MKYVIIKITCTSNFDRVYPVVFPEYLTHSLVAAGMLIAIMKDGADKREVYGAGFCRIDTDGKWECFGGSESLGIEPNVNCDRDAELMNMEERLQGIVL